MLEKIKEIIADKLNVDPEDITEETSLAEDLGADSLDMVEIIMAFESEYDVTLPEEELENIATVKDILDLMQSKGVE